MADRSSVLRETDDDARHLARTLLRTARHVPLAVLDPEGGFPFVSRVLTATDSDGIPAILVSALSAHTKALDRDPRASLLAGEPGKGDPLAYPRLTVLCLAERVERMSAADARLRRRFLSRHPKAKLYIDFPDFCFFRLVPQSASLNGGFGRAFLLDGSDLVLESVAALAFADWENETIRDVESLAPDLANLIAIGKLGEKDGNWRFCGIDIAGLDLISGENRRRFEFEMPLLTKAHIISYMSKIKYSIPEI